MEPQTPAAAPDAVVLFNQLRIRGPSFRIKCLNDHFVERIVLQVIRNGSRGWPLLCIELCVDRLTFLNVVPL